MRSRPTSLSGRLAHDPLRYRGGCGPLASGVEGEHHPLLARQHSEPQYGSVTKSSAWGVRALSVGPHHFCKRGGSGAVGAAGLAPGQQLAHDLAPPSEILCVGAAFTIGIPLLQSPELLGEQGGPSHRSARS